MVTQDTNPETTTSMAGKHQANIVAPFLKLFGPDPIDPLGNVRPLRNIRDKIFAYAWSRDRRDDHKLDWVVSQWGFNRNVPERHVPNTPYSTAAFQRLDELPCNLYLVNKQISKDFTRFVYTVNDLEIDVDLKAVYTKQGAAGLQNIVTRLQNPNFQKFTRTARVRIHFPAQYPVNNLPAFNHRALVDIAGSLDEFQQLAHLAVRVVPMQGQLLGYELRVAAFPFYPMRMTNWSIRTLNDTIFPYKWDILDGQQTRLLDKAWDLYQETGTLTASVHPCTTLQQLVSTESAPSNIAANKNGSQKRKYRKMKAAGDAPTVVASGTVDSSTTSPETMQSRPSTPLNAQSCGAELAGDQSIIDEVAGHVTTADADADTDAPATSPELDAIGSSGTQQASLASAVSSSTPRTPAQPHSMEGATTRCSSSSGRITCILTPASSSAGAGMSVNATHNVYTTGYEMGESRESRPPSPAPSSVMLDMASDAQATPGCGNKKYGQDNVITRPSGNNAEQNRVKRKQKNRKKAKKINTTKPADAQSVADSIDHANAQDQLMIGSSDDEMYLDSCGHDDQVSSSPVNLANYELQVISSDTRFVCYHDPETRKINILQRGAQVDRYLRQQERRRADVPKREAEQKQAREKRHSRKAKQLLLRRANIAADSPLSRVREPHRESSKKQKKLSVQNWESDTGADPSSNNQFSDLSAILSQPPRMRTSGRDSLASYPNEPEQSFAPFKEAIRNIEALQHGHQQPFAFNFEGFKNENSDDQELDATAQGCIEDWARSCPSDDDSRAERHYMHDEDDMYQSAKGFSAQSLAFSDDEYGYSRPYNIEDRVSQLQDELIPRSPRFTDVKAYDSQDPDLSVSEQTAEDPVRGKTNAENAIAMHDTADQIFYLEELGSDAGAPATATPDHNSDNRFLHPGQLHPGPIPFSTGGYQSEETSAQGAQRGQKSRRGRVQQYLPAQHARRGHREPGAQSPRALSQDMCNNKARDNWAAVVQASDKVLQDGYREQVAELQLKMKDSGTDHSRYAGPIKDKWTKTDDYGKCVKETTEQVTYGNHSHGSSSPSNLVAVKEGQEP